MNHLGTRLSSEIMRVHGINTATFDLLCSTVNQYDADMYRLDMMSGIYIYIYLRIHVDVNIRKS